MGTAHPDHRGLPQTARLGPGQTHLWPLRPLWGLHHHSSHTNSGQQFCCLLQGKTDRYLYLVLLNFNGAIQNKLWRNELATRKRLAREKKNVKADILFHLATSSGMSGVRDQSEVLVLDNMASKIQKNYLENRSEINK